MNKPAPHPSAESSCKGDLLLLAVVILIAYGPTLFAGLISDDLMLLRRARETSWALADLARSFRFGAGDMTDGFTPYNFAGFELHFFRPFYMAILKLEYTLFGTWGTGYHLTNLVLHFTVTGLLYLWAADFGFNRRARLLVALLFAVFVPNSFSVGWVSGRTELLAATLIITSIWCMGRFLTRKKPWYYVVSLGAFLLALCSKESAVMLPFWLAISVLFLYTPDFKNVKSLAFRIAAVAPFFLLIIPYFLVRHHVLGGFPVPPAGMFYYHQPSDPDFLPFLITRIYHAPMALFLQLPTFVVPSLFERSTLLLWTMPVVAVLFVAAVLRWLPSPFRYFFACWIGLALLPTLNIGFNPVYFYICSLVVPISYVLLHNALSASENKRVRNASSYVVRAVLVYGILYCFVTSVFFCIASYEARTASEDIARILENKPAAKNVYIFDVPWSQSSNLIPGVRLLDEAHADKKFILLNPSVDAQGGQPSLVNPLDNRTVECLAQGGTYFTTGIEQAAFAEDVIPIESGMKGEHEDYSVEIVGVAPSDALRDEPESVKAARAALRMPPREQVGATALRFTFKNPMDSPDNIFLRVHDGRVEEIELTPDRAEVNEAVTLYGPSAK